MQGNFTRDIAQVRVFVAGESGYVHFRIPAVATTNNGILLAFAEGRRSRFSDAAENDIVLKRSTDGGNTWGPLQVLVHRGRDSQNNPTVVVIPATGRILLVFQQYPYPHYERSVSPGFVASQRRKWSWKAWRFMAAGIVTCHVIQSDDDGKTWTPPLDITRMVKRPAPVTSLASGPGVGIQLRRGVKRGRILVPFNQGPYGKWQVFCALSDDNGTTWRMGATAPEGGVGFANEVQVVELSTGDVMLNARKHGGDPGRKIAISKDGGESWIPTQIDPALVDPTCQGSILRYSDPLDGRRNRILFSNPAHPSKRVQGTIRLSYDDGQSWPFQREICAGHFAYSCLAILQEGGIGCLFETGSERNYDRIDFTRCSLRWLTRGADVGDADSGT